MPSNGNRRWSTFFNSPLFLVCAILVLLFLVVSYGQAFYRDYQVREEIKRLQSESQRLEAKKIETLELLNYVKSERYVEEKARTELNLVKPGEKVVVVSTGSGDFFPKSANGQAGSDMVQPGYQSNISKWIRYFLPQ